MKARYAYNSKGKLIPIAKIYTEKEHSIQLSNIDTHAQRLVKHLTKHGYEAYIVGGAVRDLLQGTVPKDFDIVTNAHPHKIKRLFHRAHIVGKKFRIVLVTTRRNESIEVSTFRSNIDSSSDANSSAIYGIMDQDVMRRDFTCNALYYSPITKEIIDYKNGIENINKGILVPIRTEFQEDPVRMLRALKFSAKCSFKIPFSMGRDIQKNKHFIADISRSRITEEIMKVLISGSLAKIVQLCFTYKLLQYMLPNVHTWLTNKHKLVAERWQGMLKYCQNCDALFSKGITRPKAFAYFIRAFVKESISACSIQGGYPNITILTAQLKEWLKPMIPPNAYIHEALHSFVEIKHRTQKSKKPLRRSRHSRTKKPA